MTRRVGPILRSREVGDVEAELHDSDAPLRLPTSRSDPKADTPPPCAEQKTQVTAVPTALRQDANPLIATYHSPGAVARFRVHPRQRNILAAYSD